MMSPRNQKAPAQVARHHHHQVITECKSRPTSQQRNGLSLATSSTTSDGIGGSCSSSSSSSQHSCNSVAETAYQAHRCNANNATSGSANRLQQAPVQYLNHSDGSVYTLSGPNQQFVGRNNAKASQQQRNPNFLHQTDAMRTGAAGSPNLSSTANLEAPYQKQSSDLLTNVSRQQHLRLQHQVHQQLQRIYGAAERQPPGVSNQQQTNADKQQLLFRRHKQQVQQQLSEQIQQRNMNSTANREQQFRSAMMKNQHLMMINSSQQDNQTYDSLSPPGSSKHQLSESFYGAQEGGLTAAAAAAAASATASSQRQSAPISAILEECNDEDELLMPETILTSPAKRPVIDRKSQLEDLHYATVTAAALLSATANAAAAFAVTTEKQRHYERASHELRCPPGNEQQDLLNTIYSDTYQEIRKHQQDQQRSEALARYKQQHNRGPTYADSADVGNFHINERRIQLGAGSTSAIYSPFRGANAIPSQVYSIQPSQYQPYQQPAANINRQMPPQPPARRINRPVNQTLSNHAELLRQHHHQQRLYQQQQYHHKQHQQHQQHLKNHTQVGPAQVPALAILHHGGKNSSVKADLIGRMLVNNMINAQLGVAYSDGAQQKSGLVGGQNRAIAGSKLADNHALVDRSELAGYGVLARESKQLYRAPGQIFSVAPGVAFSDSSGHSNVPLVLDRELKPGGFIERICRIDLTLFWWSLLIVSFLFMGAIITISRYVV